MATVAAPNWWVDGFDGYTGGPLVPQGGWESYFAGTYNIYVDPTCARNGANGISVDGGPVLKVLSGFTTGKYVFHASVGLANTGPFPQQGRIMLLSQYLTGEDYSLWLDINQTSVIWSESGSLQGLLGLPIGGGPGTLTLPAGWADIICVIDLDADVAETYVNGQLLARHPWKGETNSFQRIEAVMVTGGGHPVCMDDFCLVPYRPRVLRRGQMDNFAPLNDPAYRGTQLNTYFNASPWKNFDDATGNKHVGVSWTGLPLACPPFKAQLSTRMQASAGGSNNDVIYMGLQAPTSPYMVWAATIANLTPTSGGTWNVGDTAKTFNFDLQNMPAGISIPAGMNLLSFPSNGAFDMLVQDDSKVDWAELKLWTCCPWWGGIQFDTVGNASSSLLQPDNKLQLTLTGPGQGASFELGEAGSVGIEVTNGPDLTVVGRSVNLNATGRRNGQDNQSLGSMSFSGLGGGQTRFDFNFSAIGATQTRLLMVSPSGQLLSTTTLPAAGNMLWPCPPCSRWVWAGAWNPVTHHFFYTKTCLEHPAEPIAVILPDGTDFGGDDDMHMQRQTITGTGISQLTLARINVDRDGDKNGSGKGGIIGNATMHLADNATLVDNIGVTGLDGLNLDFAGAKTWHFTLDSVGGVATPPNGSTLTYGLTGTFDGATNHAIGSVTETQDGTGYVFTANFTAVGATTVRVRALLNGVVQTDQPTVSSAGIGRINGGNRDGDLDCRNYQTLGIAYPTPVTYVLGGVPRLVDRIEFTPNTPGHTINAMTAVQILGSGIGEFTLRHSDTTRVINGRVLLEDIMPPTGIPVTVEIRAPGSPFALETHNVILGEDADCIFDTALSGPVDIAVKGPHWLRKTFSTYISPNGLLGWLITLKNGDCDDDNENAIGDYAIVSGGYNKCDGDPGFDSRADLNGDGCTDIADYAILSANYGLIGDN